MSSPARIDPAVFPGLPRLQAMQIGHLAEVMAIEVQAYPFPWSRGNFVDSIASGYWCQCLCAPDGAVLGYMIVMAGLDELHLLNLTVSPTVQGQGHALLMLQALDQHGRSVDAHWLWLEVRPSNLRARSIYERFGFEQVGLRRSYYPAAGGQREDALVLRRAVEPPDPGWGSPR
ncbi:MAG TPA: ribosomal protein S18-alanine N-acetyltransferase [Burkholderiaceae bacterium]|nr:ribosomal protein S18-alanine N-acetyltransferase [Burkholderiaceae bacterium]HNB46731.1 ribosomal protein S18-alanine N-acetyltransferase [Burkholderiaceae bacterium]HNG80717.1 ribosomal protein S18-alanine N-acetyltransferase [Burkholderiaceae bacterium]